MKDLDSEGGSCCGSHFHPAPVDKESYVQRTVYRAAIVSSASPTEVEVLADALLCVSPLGRIEWVEPLPDNEDLKGEASSDDPVQAVLARRGTGEDVDIVHLEEGFFCPLLIDTHTVSNLMAS